jgi:Putative DNA-binding domain
MVALRSRRLESLFGASPLDELRADQVRGLVTSGAQEAFDLDLKAATYGRSDREKRDLAGDVAALANTAGGVIVLGVEEDDQARATAAPGVEVTDAEVGRILQVVAALVSPMPVFDVLPVLDETLDEPASDGPDDAAGPSPRGFIVIAVPRSPYAPHAVLVNQSLRYPKRNGTTTRYLSEPEVAAAYRDRLAGGVRQDQRVLEVEKEATGRLDRSEYPWLVVTLVPDLPGDLAISTDVHQSFQQQMMGSSSAIVNYGTHYLRANVGRRRLLADGTGTGSPLVRWVSIELHTDGAGAYGLQVADLNLRGRQEVPNLPQLADDESIVIAVLSGLLQLARHARDRTAAGGNVVVRAQLLPVPGGQPIAIGYSRGVFSPDPWNAVTLDAAPPPAETVAALDDIAQPGPALVSVAATLADELGQAFGMPEMPQLSHDGELRQQYWGRDTWQAAMVAWAQQNGITVSDATLG